MIKPEYLWEVVFTKASEKNPVEVKAYDVSFDRVNKVATFFEGTTGGEKTKEIHTEVDTVRKK